MRNPVNIAATNPHLFEVRRLKRCKALNTCSSGHRPASSPHTAPSHSLGIVTLSTKMQHSFKQTNKRRTVKFWRQSRLSAYRNTKNENRRRTAFSGGLLYIHAIICRRFSFYSINIAISTKDNLDVYFFSTKIISATV